MVKSISNSKMPDLFTKLVGGQFLTQLDMKQAYNKVVPDEELRKYMEINKCQSSNGRLIEYKSSSDIIGKSIKKLR